MTTSDQHKSAAPTPEVEDPHPGSVSDGTHPAAREHKQPKPDKGAKVTGRISGSGDKSTLKPGAKQVNSEAPKHPNKGAYGT